MMTAGVDYYLVVYLQNYFDTSLVIAGAVLDSKVAVQIKVNVVLTNCIITKLDWPVQTYELSLIVPNDPITKLYPSFSNDCKYQIGFQLFWDKNLIVTAATKVSTFDFEQLKVNNLPSCVEYSPRDFKITVNSVAET